MTDDGGRLSEDYLPVHAISAEAGREGRATQPHAGFSSVTGTIWRLPVL